MPAGPKISTERENSCPGSRSVDPIRSAWAIERLCVTQITPGALVIGVPSRTWGFSVSAASHALWRSFRGTSSPGGPFLYPSGGLDALECNSCTGD